MQVTPSMAAAASPMAGLATSINPGSDLASLFECPVCFDYVLPPILQVLSIASWNSISSHTLFLQVLFESRENSALLQMFSSPVVEKDSTGLSIMLSC